MQEGAAAEAGTPPALAPSRSVQNSDAVLMDRCKQVRPDALPGFVRQWFTDAPCLAVCSFIAECWCMPALLHSAAACAWGPHAWAGSHRAAVLVDRTAPLDCCRWSQLLCIPLSALAAVLSSPGQPGKHAAAWNGSIARLPCSPAHLNSQPHCPTRAWGVHNRTTTPASLPRPPAHSQAVEQCRSDLADLRTAVKAANSHREKCAELLGAATEAVVALEDMLYDSNIDLPRERALQTLARRVQTAMDQVGFFMCWRCSCLKL